jgi:hypothetical protein
LDTAGERMRASRLRLVHLCNWKQRSHSTIDRVAVEEQEDMMTILIVLAVLMLIGAIPTWPHSRNWGYGPSGGLGLVLLILVILLLTGRL